MTQPAPSSPTQSPPPQQQQTAKTDASKPQASGGGMFSKLRLTASRVLGKIKGEGQSFADLSSVSNLLSN